MLLKPGPSIRTWMGVPSAARGVGTVKISLQRAGFTFTVVSNGYFDAPGSEIAFSLSARQGNLYLTQRAEAHGSNLFAVGADLIRYPESVWQRQAVNLQRFLGIAPLDVIPPGGVNTGTYRM